MAFNRGLYTHLASLLYAVTSDDFGSTFLSFFLFSFDPLSSLPHLFSVGYSSMLPAFSSSSARCCTCAASRPGVGTRLSRSPRRALSTTSSPPAATHVLLTTSTSSSTSSTLLYVTTTCMGSSCSTTCTSYEVDVGATARLPRHCELAPLHTRSITLHSITLHSNHLTPIAYSRDSSRVRSSVRPFVGTIRFSFLPLSFLFSSC